VRSAGISLNAFAVVGSCAAMGAGGAAGAGLGVFCWGCPAPFPPCGAPAPKFAGRGCAAPGANELGCCGVVGVWGSDEGVTGLGACAAAPAFFFFPASLPPLAFGADLWDCVGVAGC